MGSFRPVVLLLSLLVLFIGLKPNKAGNEQPHTPLPVNVSSIFNYSIDPWSQDVKVCPPINAKEYLQHLDDHVIGTEKHTYVSIIVGVKDAGKSKGLQTMMAFWENQGYTVMDIDLKGEPDEVTASEVLIRVARKVYKVFEGGKEFGCLYQHISETDCGSKNNDAIQATVKVQSGFWWSMGMIANDVKRILTLSTGTVFFLMVSSIITAAVTVYVLNYMYHVRQAPREGEEDEARQHQKVLVLCILVAIVVLVVLAFVYSFPNEVEEFYRPLGEAIATGNWETLTCVCNGIAMCVPQHRPILIIREFTSFEEKSRHSLFKAFGKMKQTDVFFPVIFETSDFLWLSDSAIAHSQASFKPYFLKEMTYEEGQEELVTRYKMWTQEDFDKIYNALGGHTGSYASLWKAIRMGASIEKAIDEMKTRSYSHLCSCLMERITDKEGILDEFLCQLKKNKYKVSLSPKSLPVVVRELMECNVLFSDENYKIYPQKRLLEYAIDKYLARYVNCTNLIEVN